jgi:hypothetical protein
LSMSTLPCTILTCWEASGIVPLVTFCVSNISDQVAADGKGACLEWSCNVFTNKTPPQVVLSVLDPSVVPEIQEWL